jgi:hypothetical protein
MQIAARHRRAAAMVMGVAGGIAVLLAGAAPARAAVAPEFAFSIGYTEYRLDDTTVGELARQGGLYLEPRVSAAPWDAHPQLRVGVGLGFTLSMTTEDAGESIVIGPGGPSTEDLDTYENLFLFVPELQISWRQEWSDHYNLEVGVGAGGVYAHYSAGDVLGNTIYDDEIRESDTALTVRPFVRLVYAKSDRFTGGFEGSYLWSGSLDLFDGVGGNLEQWYAGVFFCWTR